MPALLAPLLLPPLLVPLLQLPPRLMPLLLARLLLLLPPLKERKGDGSAMLLSIVDSSFEALMRVNNRRPLATVVTDSLSLSHSVSVS